MLGLQYTDECAARGVHVDIVPLSQVVSKVGCERCYNNNSYGLCGFSPACAALNVESLRSRWGQVKSTKGFGNFAIPRQVVPQGFWDMGNNFGKKILKNRSKKSLHLVILLVRSLARSLRSLAREGTGDRKRVDM